MSSIGVLWSRLWEWKHTAIDGSFPNHPVIEWATNNSRLVEDILETPHRLAETLGGWTHRRDFADVQRFTLFIGHPRSGHSLVGSLLDAHPRMIVAHELDALKSVRRGVSRRQLFFQLLARSQWFERNGARCGEYSYAVPPQHKGRFTSLRVIGDKKGGKSTDRLRRHPDLLRALWETVRVPLHVIHVKRHPLDNISTMARKGDGSIDRAIEKYFRDCETVKKIRERYSKKDWLKWVDIVQEDFVLDPRSSLRKLCEFLGVRAQEDYLNDCARIVFEAPNRSRDKVAYSLGQLRKIQDQMRKFPSLEGYSMEESTA